MVIEMLLNNDIPFFFVQMILNFQKELNVIMYIIEFFKKISRIISFEQNLTKIWIFKVYVFVMFKMKFLINKVYYNILSQQMGQLDGKGVCLQSKSDGIKPHGWCCAWSTMICLLNIFLLNH
jgi:hypothetical protein